MSRNSSHLHKKSTLTHQVINDQNLQAVNTAQNTSNGHLQNLVNYGGAGNNRVIGDASTRLQVYPYAADYAGNMRALKCDSSGRLECSVDALEVTAETINLNTDTLETKLDSLINYGGGGDNDLGDGSARLQTFMYGHDGSSTQRRVRVDGDGHLQTDVLSSALPTGAATAAHQLTEHGKLDTLETTLTNIETDQAALEVLHTATNSKLDTIDAVLDTIKTDSAAIKTSVELIDNAISGSELQVDVVAALPAGTNKLGEVALKANEAVDGSGTERHLVCDANGFLQTEDQRITVIAPNLNIADTTQNQRVNLALHDSGNSTTRTAKCNASGELKAEVSGTVTANLSATDNAVLDSILAKNTEIDTVLDTIKTDSAAIKTAVELIDNTVSGSELQVDVVAALPAGTNKLGEIALKANEAVDGSGTERHLVCDANGFLQTEDQKLTVIAPTVNLAESTQTQRVNLALHDSGNSTTRTAKCNASGELKAEVSGTVTANLSATDNAVLDDIASKAGSIKTAVEIIDDIVKAEDAAHSSGDKGVMFLGVRQDSQADFGADGDYVPLSIDADGKLRVAAAAASGGATEAKQDVIETTLTNLETSLAALDNAVDGNYLNVNLNVAGTDVDANSGNKSAASQRVVIATDDVNLSAIKTAVEAVQTDQAALEVLHTATNSALTTIDSVLDSIKVDTEAIETAVEALNTRDSLTTTLIIDGQTVASSGTHTSSSVEVTNIPPDGNIKFLVRISGVSVPDISVKVLLSADDTNFFGADLQMITQGISTSGSAQFITCNFVSKYLKIELSNSNGSSTATCSVHMFN